MKFKDRENIPEKYRWNLDSLFKTEEEWQDLYESVLGSVDELDIYKGKLERSPSNLINTIEKSLCVSRDIQRLYTYAKMRMDENTRSSKYFGMAEKAQKLFVLVSEKTSFITPELLRIDRNIFNAIMSDARCTEYTHYIGNIMRRKRHILSDAEEELLATVSDVYSTTGNIFNMLNNADLKFPVIKDENGEDVQLTHGNYIRFMESRDREVRKETFDGMLGTYAELKNTFAAILNGEVKKNIMVSRARNYRSALHASLDRNNIPVSVYENLIEAVNKNLDKLHRYIDLRKKELGLDEIHLYDLYVPLVKSVDFNIEYEDAKIMMKEGLKVLGQDYMDIMNEGLEGGWIDVYESVGKRSGAYSWGTYDSNPYIMLNYQSNLSSLFTLTHEMGHSIHSYYTRKNQPYVYGSYSIFLAEIASTVNESILINYMIENAKDNDEKKYLLNHYLEQFRGTLFRQTMFAEFELKIHQIVESGEALTRDKLDEMYLELNRKYFGEDIILDKGIEKEWQRIPHFYMNFYVFQYATGYSAASVFTKKILGGEEGALEDYKTFLKSGSSDYSIDILKKAGVDMTTTEPVEDALELFDKLLDLYESID